MADPVFDEALIIQLLQMKVCTDNVGPIQQGAVFALANLYDRKVTRDEFIGMAATILNLYGQSAKIWLLKSIEVNFQDGELDQDRIDMARVGLEELCRKHCEHAIEIVKRLQECPTTRDKVH